jgi:hypothetical protein
VAVVLLAAKIDRRGKKIKRGSMVAPACRLAAALRRRARAGAANVGGDAIKFTD